MIAGKREALSVIFNQPGLKALAYRATTHGASLRRMLDRLSRYSIPPGDNLRTRPLAALTTRDGADPVVAFIDAWAAAVDVLTFYQERIANEGYLATYTEPRSLLELSRSIGYELGPGIAAGTYLAFSVENIVDSPSRVTLTIGTQVQSVPGQDELPQTFETTAEFIARAAWNELRPRLVQEQILTVKSNGQLNNSSLYFQGLDIALRKGDLIEIARPRAQTLRVDRVTPDPLTSCTRVDVLPDRLLVSEAAPSSHGALTFRQRVGFFGSDAPPWRTLPRSDSNYVRGNDAYADAQSSWDDENGRNRRSIWVDSWGTPYSSGSGVVDVFLEQVIPEILPGSRVIFCDPTTAAEYEVESAIPMTILGYGRTAHVTGLKLTINAAVNALPNFLLRQTVAYVQSEPLLLAATAPLPPGSIGRGAAVVKLDRLVEDLAKDQLVAVQGEDSDAPGTSISEIAQIAISPVQDRDFTTLTLNLSNSYRRESVVINANVVPAGHGETIMDEVLGSGDSSKRNQSFVLQRSPLTYVPSMKSGLPTSTLSVRVNDIEWQEVRSLYDCDRLAQCFMLRTDEAGRTEVLFGDGEHGACLPSGQNNVVASYRTGSGPKGEVAAGTLKLLLNQPLGLRAVWNPLPAANAVLAEKEAQTRQELPLRLSTLDRVVALSDYQAFAAALPGIAKARARLVRNGGASIVQITVAAEEGEMLSALDLHARWQALDSVSDSKQTVILNNFRPLRFDVTPEFDVMNNYQPALVRAAVEQKLMQTFSFDSSSFDRSVTEDEVAAVVQLVPGVAGVLNVTLNSSALSPEPARCEAADPTEWLGAQLLYIGTVRFGA